MSNLSLAPGFDFRNDSAETVPAFGVVRITESEPRGVGEQLLIGAKPDGEGVNYINGPVSVAVGAVGRCYFPSVPVFAAYDDAATPANGEEWGPVNDSWELGESGSGFAIIGGEVSGRVLVSALGGGCGGRNEIWLVQIAGTPTGGTFEFDLTVNASAEAMAFDFDATAAEVETELETHSEIASGDVEVTGGPLPDAAVIIEFRGDLANTAIDPVAIDHSNLTGGSGVGAFVSRWQPGYPN